MTGGRPAQFQHLPMQVEPDQGVLTEVKKARLIMFSVSLEDCSWLRESHELLDLTRFPRCPILSNGRTAIPNSLRARTVRTGSAYFQGSDDRAMARWVLAALGVALAQLLQGCLPRKPLGPRTPEVSKCSPLTSHSYMDCGKGVEVCGVLTLETGEGSGPYKHPKPVVHGLWPEISHFGSSECDHPKNSRDPTKIYPCFDTQGSQNSARWFERHEWEAHGTCAGVRDADDFFGQVCELSAQPLQVVEGSRAAGKDLAGMADDLQGAGFCVYRTMSNSQLQLSACLDTKGHWHLADLSSFPTVCGQGGDGGGGGASGVCIKGRRGPSCTRDSDCWSASGCLRCAHSGFCTDVPLPALALRNMTSLLGADWEQSASQFPYWVLFLAAACFAVCWTFQLSRRSEGLSCPLIEADECGG